MNSEYLFTKLTGKNKGEPLDADSVYSMLKRLSKKTDINSHPHQLRHYFAEERRKEGWDLNDIRFVLGHKKVETTIKYLGENNERLIEATDQYYSNLTGKNKGEPLDADSVYSMLKRLSKKTDINSHPHQLRHYFAEERRKEGWDLNDIRFVLGHKKVETTIKYLGENNERLIEATDQYYSNNEDLYQIADFL